MVRVLMFFIVGICSSCVQTCRYLGAFLANRILWKSALGFLIFRDVRRQGLSVGYPIFWSVEVCIQVHKVSCSIVIFLRYLRIEPWRGSCVVVSHCGGYLVLVLVRGHYRNLRWIIHLTFFRRLSDQVLLYQSLSYESWLSFEISSKVFYLPPEGGHPIS